MNCAGLVVDTDLRWRIVTALAAGGEIDADGPATPFIDAEAQRDPTAAGQAARGGGRGGPSAGRRSRTQAWREVIEDDTLANITARSIIGGFVHPARASCWRRTPSGTSTPIPAVWERRSSEVAQTVVIGLYPSWDISTGRRWPPPTGSSAAAACRRRCAGWCSKAAPASSGH